MRRNENVLRRDEGPATDLHSFVLPPGDGDDVGSLTQENSLAILHAEPGIGGRK